MISSGVGWGCWLGNVAITLMVSVFPVGLVGDSPMGNLVIIWSLSLFLLSGVGWRVLVGGCWLGNANYLNGLCLSSARGTSR